MSLLEVSEAVSPPIRRDSRGPTLAIAASWVALGSEPDDSETRRTAIPREFVDLTGSASVGLELAPRRQGLLGPTASLPLSGPPRARPPRAKECGDGAFAPRCASGVVRPRSREARVPHSHCGQLCMNAA